MKGRSRFVGNTAALFISSVAVGLFTLLQVKILAGNLDRAEFGLFTAMRGLSLFVALVATPGFVDVLVRYLPAYEARGDLRGAVRTSALSFAVTVVLLVAGFVVVHHFESRLFRDVPAAEMTASFRFWFVVATTGVAFKGLLYAAFNGLRRMELQTVMEVLSFGAQVSWIFLAREQLTITLLFRIIGTVAVATVLVGLPAYVLQLVRDVRAGKGDAVLALPQSPLRYWAGATGLTLVSIGASDADRFLLSRMIALDLLPFFHVGARVTRLANRFLAVFVLSFQPEVTRLDAEGRPDEVERSTRVFEKFSIAVAVMGAALIILYAREIVLLIVNPQYLDAVPLMVVMALSLPLTAATAPLMSVMKARDQIGGALACNIGWVVSYLSLLVALTWGFGLMGAGAALTCACLVQLLVALYISDLGLGRLISTALLRALAAGVLSVPVVLAAAALGGEVAKLPAALAALVCFRLVIYRLGFFDPEERERLIALLARGPARFVRYVL